MDNLSKYIGTIFIISLCSALCEFTLKSTSGSQTLQRGLKLVISLALCVSVFVPAANVFKNGFPDFSKDIQVNGTSNSKALQNTFLEQLTKSEVEKQVEQKIFHKTGILPDGVCISFVTDNNVTSIEYVDISLKKEYSNAYEEIREYTVTLTGAIVKINGE